MAQTFRRRIVVNPAGKRRTKARTGAKRKLTPAQIAAGFGGKRRQAAVKANRSKARSAAARVKNTARTVHRARPRAQSNPGEIISLVLGNPAKKPSSSKRRTTMARPKRRKNPTATRQHRRRTRRNPAPVAKTHRRRTRRSNPAPVTRSRRKNTSVRRRRHNPSRSSAGLGGLFAQSLYLVGGAVGSKFLTQALLGAKNSGVMGYGGNILSAWALSLVAGKFMKNAQAAKAILAGGIVQVTLRAINDFTPYGKYVQQLGMGDYQASSFVTPQTLVPGSQNQLNVPTAFRPQPQIAAAGGMRGLGKRSLI